MPKRKLAIVSTHPIQYYAPVFRALAASAHIELRVFYTWSQAAAARLFDAGFGTDVSWDIPLLEGYAYQFVRNVAACPGTGHFHGLNTPTLVAEIEAWGPDAVLVYTWNSRSHLRALRYFKGRFPVLFRGDSTLIDRRPWWRKLMRRAFLTWVYSHVDVAIAVGSHNRDYFRWCGMPLRRVALAPHSVDTVRFGADAAEHEKQAAVWRCHLGIPAEAVVILFAGKLQPKKNPDILLNAFAALDGGSHLVFVGNGELEGRLQARAATTRNVHFMSFQNQSIMPAVYRLGDLFVLPSQGPEETWGLALNEAMACGRAVVASSKVGGARDLVRPGENGWTFESGDESALRAILRAAVAGGRTALHAMGRTAQARSVEWSSEESARRIGAAFLDCLPRAAATVDTAAVR
ncbi:MAG: glycosyltransferase family 4 protein [Pseudomonadota bacterium]|nr:glycosyltransferase family 4 protein [Pseudomonadota bacterium]